MTSGQLFTVRQELVELVFCVSSTEYTAARAWLRRHRCIKGTPVKARSLWYKLCHTGIGTAVRACCDVCGKQKDVTDYESW